jgi:hypothetical protein
LIHISNLSATFDDDREDNTQKLSGKILSRRMVGRWLVTCDAKMSQLGRKNFGIRKTSPDLSVKFLEQQPALKGARSRAREL